MTLELLFQVRDVPLLDESDYTFRGLDSEGIFVLFWFWSAGEVRLGYLVIVKDQKIA